jgi:serine O-acetyltransferase
MDAMEGTMPLSLFKSMREDIRSVFDRDPAARSTLELLIAYPGLRAIWAHRVEHWMWVHKLKLLARWFANGTRSVTGIEIHPAAIVGSGFFIDHGMGVVIGETAEIGHNVTIYHGVTLGGTSLQKGKRHPTIEDEVVIGAGAKILGAITIGSHSRIGANAVVVKSVPSNSVVVGVPGQVISRSLPSGTGPDLEHGRLPDTIGDSVASLMDRLAVVEKKLHLQSNDEQNKKTEPQHPHVRVHSPTEGVWHGEDFMI